MTGIEGVGWPITRRIGSPASAPGAPGFAVPTGGATAGQAASTASVHGTSAASMLSLQETGEETIQDREARRHGHDTLAALVELQRTLLSGGSSAAALQRLAELASSVPLATDRRLAAMVSAITVRVRVELARRQL